MRQQSRWWKRGRRLYHGALLAFAQGHDHRHTSCPGRQHIDYGSDFEHERGQKQGVKTEQPAAQAHGKQVDDLVKNQPTKRTQQELQSIGHNRHNEGEPDALAREDGRTEQA